MPAVQFKDRDSYKKAFKVLMQVGGPFQGRREHMLIVSDEQFEALVKANLVTPNGVPPGDKEVPSRGTKAKKRTNT